MIYIHALHHIAIICSDYTISKKFYTEILGLEVISENYRHEKKSWKADLGLNGQYIIELFSFPDPKKRLSYPEATGLRHLAFQVENIEKQIYLLNQMRIAVEPIKVDEYTGKCFTFFRDPDNLPIELYEK